MPDQKTVRVLSIDYLPGLLLCLSESGPFSADIQKLLQDNKILPDGMTFGHCLVHYTTPPQCTEAITSESAFHYTFVIGQAHRIGTDSFFVSEDAAKRNLAEMVEKYLGLQKGLGLAYNTPYTILTTPDRLEHLTELLSDYRQLDVQTPLVSVS